MSSRSNPRSPDGERFLFCEFHKFAALVFDWDGVLVDSGRNYSLAYEHVLKQAGILTVPREIYLREGQPTADLLASLFKDRMVSVTRDQLKQLADRRREYDQALGAREFFPGMWPLLVRLRDAGYKLAMVTGSSRKSIDFALPPEKQRFFHALITADDVSRSKPDPEPFTRAACELGIDAEACLVIENAPFGIESAKRAGCRVIGICTTLGQEDLQEADWVVKDHGELQSLLLSP